MGKENREYVELKVRFGIPDGNLADESIVGRDDLVASLWRKAEAGSLPAGARNVAWLYDFTQIQQRNDPSEGGNKTIDAVDKIFEALWI